MKIWAEELACECASVRCVWVTIVARADEEEAGEGTPLRPYEARIRSTYYYSVQLRTVVRWSETWKGWILSVHGMGWIG